MRKRGMMAHRAISLLNGAPWKMLILVVLKLVTRCNTGYKIIETKYTLLLENETYIAAKMFW